MEKYSCDNCRGKTVCVHAKEITTALNAIPADQKATLYMKVFECVGERCVFYTPKDGE